MAEDLRGLLSAGRKSIASSSRSWAAGRLPKPDMNPSSLIIVLGGESEFSSRDEPSCDDYF